MGGAGLAVAALPLVAGRAAAADRLKLLTWSNYADAKLYPAYAQKHGEVDASFFGDVPEALAKLRSGYVVDLAHPCADSIVKFRDSEVLQPFDTAKLTTVTDLWPELANLPGTVDDAGKRWFLPFDWGNSSIIYRTDLVELKEPSWSLIYTDDRYKGRVAMYDSGEPAMQIAGLLLGFPDVFNMSDDELAKCADLLRKQRDNARFYWSDQTAAEQALASGEVVAAYGWNDAAFRLKSQGVPVEFMNPKEGMLTWVCGLVLSKAAPNIDLAHEFANAFTSPEAGEYLIQQFGTGHANRKAFDKVPADKLAAIGISNPAELMKRSNFLRELTPDRRAKYNDLFNSIKAGG